MPVLNFIEFEPNNNGVKTHSNHKGSRRLTRRNTGKGKRSLY